MTRLHKIAGVLITLGGVGHSLATWAAFDGLTSSALWFLGSGLMLIFLGFLNLASAFSTARQPSLRYLTQSANAIGAAFMVPLYWTTRAPQPAGFFVLIAIAAVAGFRRDVG